MDITKQSLATGDWHTRDIPVTIEEYSAWLLEGPTRFVRDAFPHLSADDAEFLISGTTPEEWDELYGEEDEDVDNGYTGYGA